MIYLPLREQESRCFIEQELSCGVKILGSILKEEGDMRMQLLQSSMIEELSLELNVPVAANGFWNNVIFLFQTKEEVGSLLRNCAGMPRRDVDKHVAKARKEKIKINRFDSIEDFVSNYNKDKVATLERMFQESIDISKLSKLTTDDPYRIYTIHSSLPLAVWFMTFVIYL